jgi:hypothetical protein
MQGGLLDALPPWGLLVAIVLFVLICVEGGYRLGNYWLSRSNNEKEAPVGAMVGSTLGLLALLMAFTFGLASERYDARRQMLLDEANAIGTAYLRAEMLPDRREEIRVLLRDYVDTRLDAAETGRVAEGIRQSEQMQNQLWTHAVALGEAHPSSIVVGLFIQSLNEVIDIHANRIAVGVRNRIPGGIWVALFAIAALSLAAMGYHAALAGTSRSLAVLAVAFTFSLVIGVIADLDSPLEGFLTTNQQALIDLQQSMKPAK